VGKCRPAASYPGRSLCLAWPVERDQAIPARDKALAELAEAKAAVLSLKDTVIRRSGQDEWRALWGRGPEGAGEGAGDP
jgi:predicted secreted protein